MFSVNNNIMAAHSANTLAANYSRLANSARNLSTGLRINSAADDAAGLAIRELMRSDIAVLNQGIRNANDAISLLQTADGALAIIDEKLIRMKELAEQAATGTYDSTQRLMINSEFQAMGDEIDRIARATDFNGIKLLDGTLSGEHNGKGIQSTGKMKIHFGSANDSAEDYYYIEIGDCTAKGLGLYDNAGEITYTPSPNMPPWFRDPALKIDMETHTAVLDIRARVAGPGSSPYGITGLPGQDYYQLPVGLENVRITSKNAGIYAHKPIVSLFTRDGSQITGLSPDTSSYNKDNWWNGMSGQQIVDAMHAAGIMDQGTYSYADLLSGAGASANVGGMSITLVTGQSLGRDIDEVITVDKITNDLVFVIGGHANGACNNYELQVEAHIPDDMWADLFTQSGGDQLTSITTQEKAQKTLGRIDTAIVSKDKIRANLGALQNRFENTATNLTIQAENLQASESRISDVDISKEMTAFIKSQILSQAGVAMLGQANNLPQMVMRLVQG